MLSEDSVEHLLDRLPVDRLEIRQVDGRHFLHVGRLARFVNMFPDLSRTISMNKDEITKAAMATSAAYMTTQDCFLPGEMAAQPLLACEEGDRVFLIDGLQRAALAFARNEKTVRVRVIEMTVALAIGANASGKLHHRLFEATRHRPVGAKPGNSHTTTIMQLQGCDAPERGGQSLTKLENALKDLLYFKTICAVERELAQLEKTRRSAPEQINRRAQPGKSREQHILDEWQRRYSLPLSPSWKECANQAKRVIPLISGGAHTGKPALSRAIRSELARLNKDDVLALREQEIKHRNILLKASCRAKDCRSYAKELIKLEHDCGNDETVIENARLKFETFPINGNRRVKVKVSKKEAIAIRAAPERSSNPSIVIDFNEQVILAKGFGINPTAFCSEYTRCDSLFEAYAFAYKRQIVAETAICPAMVETVLQRRAFVHVATSHLQDLSSRLWRDLFEYYNEKGLAEIISMENLQELDRNGYVDDDVSVCPVVIC